MQRETTKKETWRQKYAAPRLGDKRNQKPTHCCSYLRYQTEATFVGGISDRRPKCEPLIYIGLFGIRRPICAWEGEIEKEEGGYYK